MHLLTFDGELPDKRWLGAQKKIANAVSAKGDSGNDVLSLDRGAGRRGNDCLLITSLDEKAGLPGFWVTRGQGNGRGLVSNIANADGYLAAGARANRLSFWLRFDDGFRAKASATAQRNLVVGTYHFDPAKKGIKKESNNWHFYHQLVIRHDKARDSWINVVVNELPHHQRALSQGFPVYNPTQPVGNYWELATRFYVDCTPYFTPAEVPWPVHMWVDDIELLDAPALHDVSVELKAKSLDVPRSVTTTIQCELTNHTNAPVTGFVAHRSRYGWTPALVNPSTEKSVHKQKLTLQPGVTTLYLQITPRQGMTAGTKMLSGVVFVPESECRPGNHSHADRNVLVSDAYAVTGPCDCSPAHASVLLNAV